MLEQLREISDGITHRRPGDEALHELEATDDLVLSVPPDVVVPVATLMDELQQRGDIESYGLTAPSLTDVFVKLCENAEAAALSTTTSAEGGGGKSKQESSDPDHDDVGAEAEAAAAAAAAAATTTTTTLSRDRSHEAGDISAVVNLVLRKPTPSVQIGILLREQFQLSCKRLSMYAPAVLLALGLAAALALAFVELSATTATSIPVRACVRVRGNGCFV